MLQFQIFPFKLAPFGESLEIPMRDAMHIACNSAFVYSIYSNLRPFNWISVFGIRKNLQGANSIVVTLLYATPDDVIRHTGSRHATPGFGMCHIG
jgi:hypothetical protein